MSGNWRFRLILIRSLRAEAAEKAQPELQSWGSLWLRTYVRQLWPSMSAQEKLEGSACNVTKQARRMTDCILLIEIRTRMFEPNDLYEVLKEANELRRQVRDAETRVMHLQAHAAIEELSHPKAVEFNQERFTLINNNISAKQKYQDDLNKATLALSFTQQRFVTEIQYSEKNNSFYLELTQGQYVFEIEYNIPQQEILQIKITTKNKKDAILLERGQQLNSQYADFEGVKLLFQEDQPFSTCLIAFLESNYLT